MTKKWGNENSWIFGNCANSQTYKSKQIYTEKCCQLEGEYELICKDSFGDGWHGGYLEIDGTKYCTDFKQGSEQATEAPMSGMHYITMVFYRFGRSRPCHQTHKISNSFGSLGETPVQPTEAPTEAPPQTGKVSNVYDREKRMV